MTLAMGVYANYPFALAAGLGLNAFVAFTLVAGRGLTWPQAMGVIVVEGLIITLLVLTGFREAILNAIPMDLKRAIGIGIGLFIAIIGLVNARDRGATGGGATLIDASTPTSRTLHDPDVRDRPRHHRHARGAEDEGRAADRHRWPRRCVAIIVNQGLGDSARVSSQGIARDPRQDASATPDFSLLGNFNFGCLDVLGLGDRLAGDAGRDAVGLLRHDGHGRRARPTRPGCSTRTAGSRGCRGTAGRLAGGRGRRRGVGLVEHHLHRERRGHRRGRPHGPHVGGRRRAASCWRSSSRRSPG